MKAKTKEQVAEEIAKLKAVPGPFFQEKTEKMIALSLEELEHGIDQTAGEFEEMTDEEQDVVRHTADWRDGYVDGDPSKEFSPLAE